VAATLAGLERWQAGPFRDIEASTVDACRHLPGALAAIAGEPALARLLAEAAPFLAWERYGAYADADIGPRFPAEHAFAPLLGGSGPVPAADFELGLFLMAPGLLYRDHHHKAPELYLPLTGPHRWRFGGSGDWICLPAHRPVWNEPWRVHATITGAVPFLSLYCWTKDVNAAARVIAAADWDMIETAL
jgi:hypothetical protein